jgi:hypothetical protein
MVIQHLSMRGGEQPQQFHQEHTFSNLRDLEEHNTQNTNKLIQVSDDDNSDTESESSDNDESNGIDEDDINDDSDDDLNEDDLNEDDVEDNSSVEDLDNNVIEIGEHNDIKILKLNVPNPTDDESSKSEDNNLDFEDLDELENLSDTSDTPSINEEIEINEINEDDVKHSDDIKSMDLKSIHINLEETKSESMDYKKMAFDK